MTRRKRLRRVLILCCHCLRNLSYYRAGWSKGALILQNDFWTTVNGNFMDICVLEWCKLFADQWGEHFWGKVVSNPATFRQELLQELNVSEQDFHAYVREVRKYRDKFVAHLDSEEVMNPPVLDVVKKSVSLLYDFILTHGDEGDFFSDAPAKSAAQFLTRIDEQARLEYRKRKAT